jgi:glycosyltransferase involved in cell wall biosynthesis
MKLIYISWFSSGEGSQVHAKEFMEAMERHGHEVIPIELSIKSQQKLNELNNGERKKQLPKRTMLTELKSIASNILRFNRLVKLIKKHKPDAIINRYTMYDISPILINKLYGIPIIYEVNASAVYEREIEGIYYLKPIAKWAEKFIFKKANNVTLVSNELLRFFKEKGYDTTRTIVIPNGVDTNKFTSPNNLTTDLKVMKEKWNDKIILGFLGSLKSWHGVERIIDCMPRLLESNKDIRFLIVGDGNERSKIEEKIRKSNLEDKVFITGFLDYQFIPSALYLFDIAVAPYHNIDFFHFSPLKVFEYMAAENPVVAPPFGQLSELIEDDNNGILIENNTDDELIAAVLDLANSKEKREKLGKNAKQFIEANYSWDVNAKKIESIILPNIKNK